MGMDVFGRNPECEAGNYFRASIWQWASLHRALVALCGDLFDREALVAMSCNEGAGPTDAALCCQIATRFESWLEGPDFDDRPTVSTLGVNAVESPQHAPAKVYVAESCQVLAGCGLRDLVEEWVRFLRHCGGFQVY